MDDQYHRSQEGKKHPLEVMYVAKDRHSYNDVFKELRKTNLPYALAQLIYITKKLPRTLIHEFLKVAAHYDKWVYGPFNKPYSFGIDELFLNVYILPKAEKLGFRIGYMTGFTIVDGFFYFKDEIESHPSSQEYLLWITQLEETMTLFELLLFMDETFYLKATKRSSSRKSTMVKRYWTLIERLVKNQNNLDAVAIYENDSS